VDFKLGQGLGIRTAPPRHRFQNILALASRCSNRSTCNGNLLLRDRGRRGRVLRPTLRHLSGPHGPDRVGVPMTRPTGSPRPCHCGRSKTLRPPKSGAMVLMLRSPHTSCRVRAPNAARHFLCLTPPSPVLLASPCVETPLRPLARLAQNEERECAGRETGRGGRMGKKKWR
jgi:hypothetical protein